MSNAVDVDLRFGDRACGHERGGARIFANDFGHQILDLI
jgi:hypothetical protein